RRRRAKRWADAIDGSFSRLTHQENMMNAKVLVLFAAGCIAINEVGLAGPSGDPSAISIDIGPFSVPAGAEVQLCRTLKLPVANPVAIDRIVSQGLPGLQHRSP